MGSRARRSLKSGPWWDGLSLSSLLEVSLPLRLVLNWNAAIGLVAKDDPCWAESVESLRIVAMLQESFSKLIGARVPWGPRLPVTSLLAVWTASCVCLLALGW